MSAGFIYPGQGSQTPGMLSDLPDVTSVRETLSEADDLLPNGVTDLDSSKSLTQTVGTQLAMLVCGVAATRALADEGASPDIVAGHSIGAFPAAVAAGALQFSEAITAVRHRAGRMAELFPHGYGMLAISGLGELQVSNIAQQTTNEGKPAWLANVNSFDQMVLTGTDAALDRIDELARAAGAHRAQRITIAGPSHAPILKPVSDELRSILAGIPERKLTARYVMISQGRPARTTAEILEDLAVSVSRTVRWRDAFGVIAELGAQFVLQLPPGRVLVGLARSDLAATGKTGVDVRAMSEERLEDCAYRIRQASTN
jgi:malonate decarboxylase epsilon subunit